MRICGALQKSVDGLTGLEVSHAKVKEIPALKKKLESLNRDLVTLLDVVESTDAVPTSQAAAAAAELEKALDAALARWRKIAGI